MFNDIHSGGGEPPFDITLDTIGINNLKSIVIVKLGSDRVLVFIPLKASQRNSPIENYLRAIFIKDVEYLVHCRCLGNSLVIMDTLGLGLETASMSINLKSVKNTKS